MIHYFCGSGSFPGVDLKDPLQQINDMAIGGVQKFSNALALLYIHVFYDSQGELILEKVKVFGFGPACHLENLLKLGDGRTALENGPLHNHLSQNASQAPNIDLFAVAVRTQQNLRRAVPSCGDILSKHQLLPAGIPSERADEPKIAKLDLAGLVYKDIGGFYVPVHEVCGVEVGKRVSQLVEDVVFVDLLQD
jgi:hypothetical protein